MTTEPAPRARKDPMLPLLAAAVTVVILGAILHFYPRFRRWLGSDVASVHGHVQAPDEEVPVWVCRGVEGVGLLLRATRDDEGLADAFDGGPYSFLTLHVWNFAREEPFELTLPPKGLLSPEGGEPALPASSLLRNDLPARLRPVLLGVGAVPSLKVPKGHGGKALLAVRGDPAARTGFGAGTLSFERKKLERRTLAQFEQRPDPKQFEDF